MWKDGEVSEGNRRAGFDRRPHEFAERLSIILVQGALIGGFIVLFDIKIALSFGDQMISVGSGFAPETKGMVLQSMLISGFAAVVAYWLGSTKQGQEQAQSVSRIAESAPVSTAAAVAANVAANIAGHPIKAEDVKVEAAGDVTVNQPKETKP